MKLKLEASTFGVEKSDVLAYLNTELATPIINKDGFFVEQENSGEYDQGDIFELGSQYGKEREREIHTRPESFLLEKKWCDAMREAIKEYEKSSYVSVTSIKFKEVEGAAYEEVIFQPTKIQCLLGIFVRYERICHKIEN
jgi:hypothetical protein